MTNDHGLVVIYEDDALLVVDKPAGVLVHPVEVGRFGRGRPTTLDSPDTAGGGGTDPLARVQPGVPTSILELARLARPGASLALAHRLDRETSGVLVLTKGARADRVLKRAFAERRVDKRYLAIVHGWPTWEVLTCDVPLGRAWDAEVTLRRRADPAGEHAVTRFEVQARLGTSGRAWALVACLPETGRTHQLRAHLAHLGHPILGDKLYGQPDAVFLAYQREGTTAEVRAVIGFPRQALHAAAITLLSPATGETVTLEAPLPPDMAAIEGGRLEAVGWML